MPQIARAARVEERHCAMTLLPEPNDQRDALAAVGERLLAVAAEPATSWTPSGRADARRVGRELLLQAGETPTR
jgi:hypothetical protein